MVVCGVSKSEIRLTPAGFCWAFHGKEVEGGTATVEIHFDFIWFKWLARDLQEVLRFRDEETAAARKTLAG